MHKAMGIYMGGVTLDTNTFYPDICYIAMVGKGLKGDWK